jgi:hypothetical protein
VRILATYNIKGGVGKTVVATNLGVALAKAGHRTILVDLDLQFGDTGIMLQLKPTRTIFDAMQQYDRLDQDMLEAAQNYVLGSFPTRLETARQLAAQFAMLELYGLDAGYVDNYGDAIGAVSVDSLAPVIREVYPAGDGLVFVIIGDAEAIRETVARYGALTEISITDGSFRAPPDTSPGTSEQAPSP